MKKKINFTAFFICSVALCQAQIVTDRPIALSYYGQYVQPFFENFHKVFYNNDLSNKGQDIDVIAHFNIDTSGNVINLVFNSSDTLKNVISYVTKMLSATTGHWLPQVRNGNVSISDAITCSFYFAKKGVVPTKARLQRMEKQQAISNGWIDVSNLFGNADQFDLHNLFVFLEF